MYVPRRGVWYLEYLESTMIYLIAYYIYSYQKLYLPLGIVAVMMTSPKQLEILIVMEASLTLLVAKRLIVMQNHDCLSIVLNLFKYIDPATMDGCGIPVTFPQTEILLLQT